jgi:Sulfotransferase family
MLISRERKLLFIHIQKTGGSTVAQLLRSRIPDMRWYGGTHEHALRARAVLGREYDSFYRFAFVRNPWDRLVSWYAMIRQMGPALPPEKLNRLWRYVLERSSSFEEFILRCTDTIDDVDGRKSFLHNQLDYISDKRGRLMVDWVGRYERFDTDLRGLLDRIGFPDVEIPHTNRSRHRHYSSYYTPLTRDLVAERYARDIQAFGYAFETAEDRPAVAEPLA